MTRSNVVRRIELTRGMLAMSGRCALSRTDRRAWRRHLAALLLRLRLADRDVAWAARSRWYGPVRRTAGVL